MAATGDYDILLGSTVDITRVRYEDEIVRAGDAPVLLSFSCGAYLEATYWRLTSEDGTHISNFDDAQQYGLPAPIDAVLFLAKKLSNSHLTATSLNRRTADVLLTFSGNLQLEIFGFTGYEIWNLKYPDGRIDYSNQIR